MNRKALKGAAKTSLQEAGTSAKKVTLVLILLLLALAGIDYGVSALVSHIEPTRTYLSDSIMSGMKYSMIALAISFVLQMVSIILLTGYVATGLELRLGRPVTVSALFSAFSCWSHVVLLYILQSLFLALQASVLSIIPSVVLSLVFVSSPAMSNMTVLTAIITIYSLVIMELLSYRYRMAFFALMENPALTPMQALRFSVQITRYHRVELFLLDLSFVPWLLLCGLTCGILLIWKLPYILVTNVNAYDYMKDSYMKRQTAQPGYPPTQF